MRLKDLATPLRTVVSTSTVVSASTFLWLEVAVIRYRGDSRQINTRLPRERYSELGKQRGFTSNVRPHHIPFPNQMKHGRMEVENLPWGIGILNRVKLCENLRRRTVRTVGHAHIKLQNHNSNQTCAHLYVLSSSSKSIKYQSRNQRGLAYLPRSSIYAELATRTLRAAIVSG